MYISRLACVNGGLPHDSRRADAEPPVRQRHAGDRLGVAVHPAGRHRRRGRRRRREHEPRRLRVADAALGRADGRLQDDRHDGRRADRPVRHRAHGRHRRERRDQVRHHPRPSRTRSPSRATSAPPRRSPPATSRARSCRSSSRARRARSMFDTDEHVRADVVAGRHGQAQGRVRQGKRHGHRRQRVRHQRRRRRRRADGEVRGREEGPEADGAPRRATATPASTRRSWAWARSARCSTRSARPASSSPTWTSSSRTRRSPRRRWASTSELELRPGEGATRTAARSRSATRSARPARSSTVKAMYELQRTGGRYGLITMCIGGGQGIAAIIERL